MKIFTKQPRDHLDYDIDLSGWMAQGDEVKNIEVLAPEGIEVTGSGFGPDRVKLWVAGGETGKSYKFSVLVYTLARIKEVDFMMIVQEM